MTTDQAISLIPPGWRLLLMQVPTGAGWMAELVHLDGGSVVDEADTPAEAVRLVAEEAGRG